MVFAAFPLKMSLGDDFYLRPRWKPGNMKRWKILLDKPMSDHGVTCISTKHDQEVETSEVQEDLRPMQVIFVIKEWF